MKSITLDRYQSDFKRSITIMKNIFNAASNENLEVNGIKLPNDNKIISENIKRAIILGYYEKEERENLPYIFNENEVVLELGTGLGLISTLCAKDNRVNRIVTIEANPKLIPYIQKVYEVNGVSNKIKLINALAYPEPSTSFAEFYVREDFWASSVNSEAWGYEEKIEVPVRNLNDLINKTNPTTLIVDIEGGENTLFDNINMHNVQKVYIELHQNLIGREAMKKIFDDLSSLGFHYDQWHSAQGVVLFSKTTRDSYTYP